MKIALIFFMSLLGLPACIYGQNHYTTLYDQTRSKLDSLNALTSEIKFDQFSSLQTVASLIDELKTTTDTLQTKSFSKKKDLVNQWKSLAKEIERTETLFEILCDIEVHTFSLSDTNSFINYPNTQTLSRLDSDSCSSINLLLANRQALSLAYNTNSKTRIVTVSFQTKASRNKKSEILTFKRMLKPKVCLVFKRSARFDLTSITIKTI